MKQEIEIHSEDTANTGTYKIWYKYNGQKRCCRISEQYVNSLLSMKQKEDFFMGKYKFMIHENDFIDVVINGKERGGMGKINRTQIS
jgi:hypothetical protein